MEEIYDKLYVGDDAAYDKLKDNKRWSFLRCCKYGPGGHQQTLDYHTLAAPDGKNKFWVRRGNLLALNLLDLDDPNFVDPCMIQSGLDFVNEELKKGQKVLISCNQGRSRGPTVGLLWLRQTGNMPHAFLLSVRIYRELFYPYYEPGQGIEQFARERW